MKKRLLHLIFVLLTICAANAQELYVGTYNVRYKNSSDTDAGNGWNTRRTYLINLVNFQQPDLLGVQEATNAQMTDLANGLSGYAYVGVGRNDGATSGEYSAIFYRKARMVLLDKGDFWLSDTPYTPSKGFPSKGGSTTYYRICSWGKFFDKATGTVVYHFNTHMDLDETNRQQSYYLIKKKIQDLAGSTNAPVMVTGDFNAVQTGEAYKLFYNSGFLYDCYHRAKQKFITNGTCPGFNAGTYSTVSTELRRIDHIFVTRAFNVEHYGVLNPCYYSTSGTATYYERAYSDHSPVMAKLSLRTPDMAELDTSLPPLVGSTYQISSAKDLKAFSNLVNGLAGYKQNAAAKAVLTQDIDMSEVKDWLPIGTSSTPFTGSFNGQGHSIENLLIDTHRSYSGLFGMTSGATIRGFYISGTLKVDEGTGEHGTIGYASNTTIREVHSALNITISKANGDTKHVGGIAGTMASGSAINRCSFQGTITDEGSNTVGGLVGYADQSSNNISYAVNYGTVHSKGAATNTGGILGYVNYNGIKISYCVNVGSVTGNKENGGQIVGRQVKAMTIRPSYLYYLDGEQLTAFGSSTEATSATGATAMKMDDVVRGELTALLNNGKTPANHVFFQNINEGEQSDPYPVFSGLPEHKIVYQGTFGEKQSESDETNYNFYVNEDGRLANLPLVNAFSTPVVFTADHASYRSEATGSWGTVYLPFAVESTENLQFYEVVPEQISESVLTIAPCTTLKAYTPGLYQLTGNVFEVEANNVPVAIPPSTTSVSYGNFVLTGTLGNKTDEDGGYVLNGNSFHHTENVMMNAFQVYLTVNGSEPQEITLFISENDGVNLTPALSNGDGIVYDLQGRRVNSQFSVLNSQLKKGIYIVNGKKILK